MAGVGFYFLSAANENEKTVKSKIENVTVFLNGAEVTRTASVSLNAGINTIVFSNLSKKVDEASIQASSSANARILNTDYQTVYVTTGKQDSAKIQKLNDSIEVANKEIRRIGYLEVTYESEKKILDLNNQIGQGNNGMSILELQKLYDVYHTKLMEINKQLFLLSENEMALNKKIGKFNADIAKLKAEVKGENVPQVKVMLMVQEPAQSEVSIKYLTGGAAWAPKYDIRVEGVSNEIEIDYMAHVMNQSGEDWEKTNLILSTAEPYESHEIPALKPWTLNNYSSDTYEGRLNEYGPKQISKNEANQKAGNIGLVEGVDYEEIYVPDMNLEFKIAEKYTVPADNKPYLIDVAKYNLKSSFEYFTIPKIDNDAFLLAQITGWEKLNLIEGQTNIYFKGTYIGHSYVKPQYANDTVDISLGRDNKIIMNRIKVEDKSSSPKIIGNSRKEMFTYKITVRNTNKSTVTVTVQDQLPVSQDKDIEVSVVDIDKAQMDTLSGSLKWKLNLKAGEAKELTVSFSVKYPKDKRIRITSDHRIQSRRIRAKF